MSKGTTWNHDMDDKMKYTLLRDPNEDISIWTRFVQCSQSKCPKGESRCKTVLPQTYVHLEQWARSPNEPILKEKANHFGI